MTLKSLLSLALLQGQIVDAVQLSISEEELQTLLAQIDTENLTTNEAEGANDYWNYNLAQLGVSQLEGVTHACSAAHDRSKLELPDFYAQTSLFTDDVFPKEDALFWDDYDSENSGQVSQFEPRVTWHRAANRFPNNPFWGNDGITPLDVRQGAVGDCWFMVAASALAEKPHRLEKIFLNVNGETNKNGIYGVNLYALGVPHTVIVDDFLPLQRLRQRDGSFAYETLFAHVTKDQSMWGVILEKAMAKLHGNYQHLVSGDPRESARTLNGSPSLYHVHDKDAITADFLWEELTKHDTNHEMMFLNTPWDGSSFVNDCGLQMGHAYVALKAIELSNGARLIQMRNPWGSERYKCDYSDSSTKWTTQLREEAGATLKRKNDGVFFMTVEDFYEQGQSTVISYDTTNWFNDHFLMLDDKTGPNGGWNWCGETCTRHIVQVESEVEQDVFITAHTWEARSYPNECKKKNKVHSIYMLGSKSIDTFEQGTHQMKPVAFKAREKKQFVLEFDWSREDITPDWSITTWAEQGRASILYSDGRESDSLPFIKRTKGMQDPEEEAIRVQEAIRAAALAEQLRAAEAAEAKRLAELEEQRAEEARLQAERIAAEFARWEAQKAEEARLELERAMAEMQRQETEREAARERARIEAERAAAEEAARIEQARIQAEREAAEEEARLKALRLEAERLAAMREAEEEAQRLAAEAEAKRVAAEQARIAAEKEAARIAAEKARIEREQEEARRLAEEKRLAEEAEAKRLAELARIEAERIQAARIAAELERARLEAEAREAERLRREAEEKARLEREAAEAAERARQQALAEQRAREQEEARLQAAAEEAARIEAEQKRLAAEAAAREAARIAAEQEAARKAAEEARIAAEKEAARVAAEKAAAEEAARKAAEEARIAAEKEAARIAAEKAAAEEERRMAEEKRLAEEEAARLALQKLQEEARQRQLEEEARQARIAAEAAKRAQEEEAARVAAEMARIAAEEEAARIAAEQARIAAEQEAARIAAEQERIAREAEEAQIEAERQAAAKRAAAEAEFKRLAQEAVAKRLEEEARIARLDAEAKAAELARKEAERVRLAEEARLKAEEAERLRLALEEAERQAQIQLEIQERERAERQRQEAEEAAAKARAREQDIREAELEAQLKEEAEAQANAQLAQLEADRLKREAEQKEKLVKELLVEEEIHWEEEEDRHERIRLAHELVEEEDVYWDEQEELSLEEEQRHLEEQARLEEEARKAEQERKAREAEAERQRQEMIERQQRMLEMQKRAADAEKRRQETLTSRSSGLNYDWSFLGGSRQLSGGLGASSTYQAPSRLPLSQMTAISTQAREPLSSTTTRQPLSSTTTRQPLAQTTTMREPISSTTRQPLATTTTRQPLATSTRQPIAYNTSQHQPSTIPRGEFFSMFGSNRNYSSSQTSTQDPYRRTYSSTQPQNRESANTISATTISHEELLRNIMNAPIRSVTTQQSRQPINVQSTTERTPMATSNQEDEDDDQPIQFSELPDDFGLLKEEDDEQKESGQNDWWQRGESKPLALQPLSFSRTPMAALTPNSASSDMSDQDELNQYVLNTPVKKVIGSACNFSLKEKRDTVTDKHKIAAVHDCNQYGVNLILYLKTEDIEQRQETEFKIINEISGEQEAGNDLVECKQLSSELSKCTYYMAPDNQRMGLMYAPGSYGLKFYTTNWVLSKE